jgi:hypothetical protein
MVKVTPKTKFDVLSAEDLAEELYTKLLAAVSGA